MAAPSKASFTSNAGTPKSDDADHIEFWAQVVILNGAQRSEESPTLRDIADPSLRSG